MGNGSFAAASFIAMIVTLIVRSYDEDVDYYVSSEEVARTEAANLAKLKPGAIVSGTVVEVHSELADQLEKLNDDPYNFGWIMKVKMSDPSEAAGLLDWAAYQKSCDSH